MLNPAVSQTPLLQNLEATVPDYFICSKTVKIRNYVWSDGHEVAIPKHEQDRLTQINSIYKNTGLLDPTVERKTEVVDPLVNCINVKLDCPTNHYASVTPAPCCGLYDEVVQREDENPYVMLSPQQIEFRPDRYLEHGRMIDSNNGVLKTFNLPLFDKQPLTLGSPANENYVVLEFELNGFSVATGMLGLGLPPITLLGVFFENFFAKENLTLMDIPFAVGIYNLRPMVKQSNIYRNTNHTQNNLRKANIKGYFVFKVQDQDQARSLVNRLEMDFMIANTFVANKTIYYTNQLPKAYWMSDMSNEITERLKSNPKKDVLDIAFDFSSEGRLFSPVATGFALFAEPETKDHMKNVKYPHAWAETVFGCTELVYGEFNEQYLYRRKYNDLFVRWDQN